MIIRDKPFLRRIPIQIFASDTVLDTVDHVRHHSAGGGQLAGAFAVEHNLVGRVAYHADGIEDIAHAGKRRFFRHHSRRDVDLDSAVLLHLEKTDQLDGCAKFLGIGNILERNIADTLHIHVLGIDVPAANERSKDANLAARVETVHIGGGILFRIA